MCACVCSYGGRYEGFKELFDQLFLFLFTSEVRTHCERTQQTGEFVSVVDHMPVNGWRSCKSCLWLHLILSVLLQVLRLRELRSGLHEEGRRVDDVTGLAKYFSGVKSMHLMGII